MAERKSIISTVVDPVAQRIVFTVEGAGSITLDVGALDNLTKDKGMFHGFEQKVRDAGAIPRDTKTGRSASPSEKLAAMRQVVENLTSGVWNVKGGGKPSLNRAALFEAIAQVRGVEASVVEAKFRDRPNEVLQSFLTVAEIAAAYAAINTPKQSAMADELLGELE